jgi:hypothetical protein
MHSVWMGILAAPNNYHWIVLIPMMIISNCLMDDQIDSAENSYMGELLYTSNTDNQDGNYS